MMIIMLQTCQTLYYRNMNLQEHHQNICGQYSAVLYRKYSPSVITYVYMVYSHPMIAQIILNDSLLFKISGRRKKMNIQLVTFCR